MTAAALSAGRIDNCQPGCVGETIQFASDLVNEGNYVTGTNVAVPAHPAWATPPVGASWISFANTGYEQREPGNSTTTPIAVFWEAFYLPNGFNFGNVRIWADDTAALYLDGNPVGPPPNFTQGTCAIGPLGCEQDEYVDISLDGLGAGYHILTGSVYQVGSGPTAWMYSGMADSLCAETPEPGTYALFGGGLVLIALARRRRG